MSLVVCVRNVLNDIFVQINILRCAYMLTFLLSTCLHGYGTCIRMCMHMCTCLGTKILSHIHIKRAYVYTHGCVYPCVYLRPCETLFSIETDKHSLEIEMNLSGPLLPHKVDGTTRTGEEVQRRTFQNHHINTKLMSPPQ